MPHTPFHTDPNFGQGTAIPDVTFNPPEDERNQRNRIRCINAGGNWDPNTNTCDIPIQLEEDFRDKPLLEKPATPDLPPTPDLGPSVITETDTGAPTGVTIDGSTFLGLPRSEIQNIINQDILERAPIEGAPTQAQLNQRLQGGVLAAQVGNIQPSTATETPVDFEAATRQGIVSAIPRALGLASTGAAAGLVGGAAAGSIIPGAGTAAGAASGAALGAVGGFVSGISSGIISDMRSQRKDNTNAQQRVLDEGKQTLKDWSTLAKADPANREFYLSQFNRQLQLIQDAHVQMLTDTNGDLAKFESAVPNLAEFDSFYSVGGERDALINEMQNSLVTPSTTEYEMLALAQRRRG